MEDYDGLDQPSTKSQNMRTTIPEYLRARLEGGREEEEEARVDTTETTSGGSRGRPVFSWNSPQLVY